MSMTKPPEKGAQTCKLPPKGWYCNLEDGHEGPCPTYPKRFSKWYWRFILDLAKDNL